MRKCDLTAAWPEAEPMIARALEGSDDTTQEVYDRCVSGAAWLVEMDRGFVVLEFIPCGEGFDILIWVAASRGQHGCIEAHLPEVEALAKALGSRRVAFKTNRRGFERVMPEGWSIRQFVWAKEL